MASTQAQPLAEISASTACPCCGEKAAIVISNRDGKTLESLTTVSCAGCGMGRIDPMPTEMDLEAWYSTHYREMYKGSSQPQLRHVLRAARNALDRFDWLEQQGSLPIKAGEPFRTLDIGASSGEFVALMQARGYDAHGIEPHKGYASFAKSLGLNVLNGHLRGALGVLEAKTYDLITMFHVLEHLTDPVGALKLIGRSLSDRGRLFIEIPNATRPTSPTYMFFRAHTLYFDQPALSNLLETAGFEVVALNSPAEGNLRVIGRYTGVEKVPATASHAHPLVRAQRKRKWGRYLLTQALSGQPFRKLLVSFREKKSAKAFEGAKDLLDSVYSHVNQAK